MNLLSIRRAVVCAALIALGISGAGLFKTQPVAGKESKRQTLHGAAALDQLKQTGQYESLQAAMRQARFGVSRAEQTPLGRAAWRAPNPAAGYDAYVTEEGVSIAVNDKSYVSLSLHSLGYGHAMRAVAPGEVSADKQNINITRDDSVQEWYVNGPDGLEQGFTLNEPPGARQGAALRLALQVRKGWRAVASEDGQKVILRGPRDEAVEYGKLVVRDSEERNIPARLTVAEEQIVIEVEDSNATYPLTIDPIFSLQQKLTAADGAASEDFGASVALDGDTLVVGAWQDHNGANTGQGSAYVFTRSGSTWAPQQKLIAVDGATHDWFGISVAISGDTLVVGAYGDDVGANTEQGSAYVFTRNGGVWTQQQKLTANDGWPNDWFGVSVALDGDTLVGGAFADSIGANGAQGSAYVFTRSGGAWTQQQKLTANDGGYGDYFGYVVALDGDILVAGAFGDDIGANADQGSAYVFTRGDGVWTQQQKLTASDGAANDWFGYAVAISGATVVAGAHRDDIGANADQGSAYVFTRGGVWTEQQKLTANDGAAEDYFGYAVALSGDNAVVGALQSDIGANANQGSAYVFTRNGAGVWALKQKLTANDAEAGDEFGFSVTLSGDTAIVGAIYDDINTNPNQGSVYVYFLPPCPTLTFAPASLPNGAKGGSYQQQITVSGGAGPFQFEHASGVKPPGLTLMTNGMLSGVPTTPGTYTFKVRATDVNSGCSGIRKYTIQIAAVCRPITIDPPTLPNGLTGTPYNETLTATGGMEPYTFSVKGKLPPGLSLSQGGVLSGTPTQAGYFNFTMLVRDAIGCPGMLGYSIPIKNGDIEIGVAPPANGGGRRGVHPQPATRRR
ncbi:MAG: putative Ig domain-containing protein [Blastocatellales bacterium]